MTFLLRTISSILLIGIFLISIYAENPIGHIAFTVLAMGLGFFAIIEFFRMIAKQEKYSYPFSTAMFGIVLLYAVMGPFNFHLAIPILILFILYCWIRILFSGNQIESLEKVVYSLAALFLLIVPLAFLGILYRIGEEESFLGRKLLVYLVFTTKFGDIAAYCVGVWTNSIMKGNHKILPSISPKKSWEGTIAGLVGSVLMSVVLWKYLQISGANAIVPIVFGVFLFIGGFAGDLAESSLKRICNVKDSGTLVPGMGGVLDVLDSLLLNAPVFTLLCIYTF